MKIKQRNDYGVITILISLMLTGILSLGTMVIEAGRLQGARTQLDDANLSAGTSMIAAYDSTLYERYGLLAIDNDMFNVGRFREYLDFNSDRSAGYKGNNISTLYTVKSVEMEGLYNLTYPSVLKRQLTSRAKFHIIPQDYSLNYYNMDYFITDYQNKAGYVSDVLQAATTSTAVQGTLADVPANMQSALKNVYGALSKTTLSDEAYDVTIKIDDLAITPSHTGTVAHTVRTEDKEAINDAVKDANTVLGASGSLLASNSGSVYKETDVAALDTSFVDGAINEFKDLNQLSSKASSIISNSLTMVQSINAALNMLSADKEGTLLLNSYVAGYFPNRNFSVEGYTGCEKGKKTSVVPYSSFAGACVEYVFTGDSNEIINQKNASNYIIASRWVSNLYSTFTNSPYFKANNACSVAAHIAWAYFETRADFELLAKYKTVVPLSKSNMILPISNISVVNSAFTSKDFLTAMRSLGILKGDTFTVRGYDKTNYRDALAFALWFVPNTQKMLRVADLIQLEMRYKEYHIEKVTPTFLMSEQNTFCRVKCVGNLNSVLPVISLGSSDDVKGTPIQSIKYVGY